MRLSRSAILSTRNSGNLPSWDDSILKERLKKAIIDNAMEDGQVHSVNLIEQVWSQIVNREEVSAMRSMLSRLPMDEEEPCVVRFNVTGRFEHELVSYE